jgi:hypothetical protein
VDGNGMTGKLITNNQGEVVSTTTKIADFLLAFWTDQFPGLQVRTIKRCPYR